MSAHAPHSGRRAPTGSITLSAAALLGTCALTSRALGEPPPPELATVPTPGRAAASDDQASAIVTNPANLAFLAGSELRWMWVRTRPTTSDNPGSPDPARGHAFDVAFPFLGRFGTGLRLDFVRPPSAVPLIRDPYTWFTWGLGVRASDAFSGGISIEHSYSSNPFLSGATGLSAAASVRPSPYFGLALVGRNLNAPHTDYGFEVDRSVTVGIAVRPTGDQAFEIGLEDRYREGPGQWLPRATLGVDIPYVGRLRGEVATSDPTLSGTFVYTATAGLELGWGTFAAEGGGVFGSMLNGGDGAGFYAGAAITSYRNRGLPESTYAVRVRIEDTPGVRGHVRLLRRLWRLAADPEVRAVALVLKDEPASSLAHAEELGDAVRMLRANGKKVVCQLENARGSSLYVCSQADRTVLAPGGIVMFGGLRSQSLYLAGMLEKLGVRAQFVRVGAHKSAPEMFTRTRASDVARDDRLDLLNETNREFLSDVGGGRHVPPAALSDSFAHGPFLADEAKRAGLVDGTAFDDELESIVAETVGEHLKLRDEASPRPAPARFGAERKVALIYVEGDMVDGRSRDMPLIGTRLVGSYTIAKALKDAREDPLVGAVVLRIESPGGSSIAADLMWREARLTGRVKPVIVSMGTYAASGGYYVACGARSIWANPLTITGSIGVFTGKADLSGLLAKLGVNVESYRTTPRADGDSFFRPYSPDELEELERKVGQLYGIFVARVAEGRNLSREAVDELGQGRVWLGRQAYDRKLVDHLGGLREALEEARHASGLPYDAPVDELPVPQTSLLELASKLAGVEAPAALDASIPPQLLEAVRAVAPFAIFAPDEPLARLELAPLSRP